MTDTLYLENKSQARILLSLLRASKTQKSQSGYDLRENYKIPYSTWSDNYKLLEQNQLIQLDIKNRTEQKRKKNSTKKTKPRYPYMITKLGIFLLIDFLLKHKFDILSNKKPKGIPEFDLNKKDVISFYEFIPLIWGNVQELQKIFEYTPKLNGILKNILATSISRIHLFTHYSEMINETWIAGEFEIYPTRGSNNSFIIRHSLSLDSDFYDSLDHGVFEILTFLFYYHLFDLMSGNKSYFDSVLPLPISFDEKEKLLHTLIQKKSALINLVKSDYALDEMMTKIFNYIEREIYSESLFHEAKSLFHEAKSSLQKL